MPSKINSEVQDQILKELKKNNDLLKKSSSVRFAFLRGLVFGLATLIGGTLLVTLILYILSLFQVLPVVGTFFTDFLTFINTTYKWDTIDWLYKYERISYLSKSH